MVELEIRKPIFKNGVQIGPCGLCARPSEPYLKTGVDGHSRFYVVDCPILRDAVNVNYGGCWKFKRKTNPKTKRPKTYYTTVEEMRRSVGH